MIYNNLKASLLTIKLAKLMNIPYSLVYTYYKNLQYYGAIILLIQKNLKISKIMSIYMKNISKIII